MSEQTTKRVRLGEVCEIIGGGTPTKKNPAYYTGNIPWATVRDMNCCVLDKTEHHITEQAVSESATNIIPKGEVVISTHVGLGKVCILAQDTAINQDLKAVIPSSEILRWYLYFWFLSKARVLIANGSGATVKGVTVEFVKNLQIEIPPLAEQKRIAGVLDKISAMKRNAEARVQKLDLLVKSRFVEMFGDVDEMEQWTMTAVGDISTVCVGVVIKPTQYYCENGIRTFRSLNVGAMRVKDNDWVYFSRDGHLKNQKSVVREGDVLVVRSGAPGTACVVPKQYDGCNAVDIIIAHPNIEMVSPIYLAMFTNMPHGKNQISLRVGGAAQQHFNVGGYKAIKIPLPPLALQREFAAFVEKVEALKATAQRECEQVDLLYRAKLQEYFG